MQIEDYHGDINPYQHSSDDSVSHINLAYLLAQAKASTAFAGHLAGPIAIQNRLHLPILWFFK